jgi:hypothetical protein
MKLKEFLEEMATQCPRGYKVGQTVHIETVSPRYSFLLSKDVVIKKIEILKGKNAVNDKGQQRDGLYYTIEWIGSTYRVHCFDVSFKG